MRIQKILLGLALAVTSNDLNAQNYKLDWANQIGGIDYQAGESIATDASGNVYTTGWFQGTTDFDPGSGIYNLTSSGNFDIYISKLDPSGNFLWAQRFGGPDDDRGNSITIDASGNIYSTGFYRGVVDFDFGAGTSNLTSAGGPDVFILKLSNSGNLIWVKGFGGASEEFGNSIAVDASGNVYTTGSFLFIPDFDPGAGVFNLNAQGNIDAFICKLDALGNFVFAKQLGGAAFASGFSLSIDASGNIYTTGYFSGTLDFDPGASTFNLTSAGGNTDIFISKLDASGNFIWAKQLGGADDESGLSVAVDANGSVYTTGYFRGSVDFDPGAGTFNLTSAGTNDIYINKLDALGNYVWTKQIGGSNSDIANSIYVDASNNIYITGSYAGTVDFDPGTGIYNLVNSGGFISKLNASGNFVSAWKLGGPGFAEGSTLILDAFGNVLTTGLFFTTGDFDPRTCVQNLVSLGSADAFVHKMSVCGNTIGTDVQSACNSYTWIDGNTYTSSNNTATFNIACGAADGCDSLVTLNLTIYNPVTGTDVQNACNSYTWIDGNTYTSSNNTATFNIIGGAVNGCDSLVTLNLTIYNPVTGTDVQNACNSYIWIDGNTYTSSNNTATFNIIGGAANGCDSLVALNLTIYNPVSGTDVQNACNSYTWIDGNTYTSNNNTATFNIIGGASNGCDSLVTLNLTINNVSDITTTTSGVTISSNNASASYQWLDCNNGYAVVSGETSQFFTPFVNGSYAVQLMENGCMDTSACVSITTIGIIENNFGHELIIYPNPTEGNFTIDLGAVYESTEVAIKDVNNKLIFSKVIYNSQVLDLSIDEPSGIYLLSLTADHKKALIRVIKE
jgi:hypothetical protein